MRASTLGRLVLAVAIATLLAWSATGRAATLLHYDFSDGSGTTVTDLSGAGNDGTLTDFADTSAGAGDFGASDLELALYDLSDMLEGQELSDTLADILAHRIQLLGKNDCVLFGDQAQID